MMVITGESPQNLTNIVNAVAINIDCRYVWVLPFHEFYLFQQRTEAAIFKRCKVLMSVGITKRQIILAINCAKMLLNYYKNASAVCSSQGIIFRLHSEGSLRSLWVLCRRPCLNNILTSVQQHSHYLLNGLKSIWNYFKHAGGINPPQTALTSGITSIIFIHRR